VLQFRMSFFSVGTGILSFGVLLVACGAHPEAKLAQPGDAIDQAPPVVMVDAGKESTTMPSAQRLSLKIRKGESKTTGELLGLTVTAEGLREKYMNTGSTVMNVNLKFKAGAAETVVSMNGEQEIEWNGYKIVYRAEGWVKSVELDITRLSASALVQVEPRLLNQVKRLSLNARSDAPDSIGKVLGLTIKVDEVVEKLQTGRGGAMRVTCTLSLPDGSSEKITLFGEQSLDWRGYRVKYLSSGWRDTAEFDVLRFE
jgi:hypothetical protein